MASPANALQAGIYTRLTAQLSETVYNHVSQKAAFPYVRIGDDIINNITTKDVPLWDIASTIHVFTKGAGSKTNNAIVSNIIDALDRQEANISLTGYNVVKCELESEQSFQEEGYEGEKDHYYHGVVTFRLLVEQS